MSRALHCVPSLVPLLLLLLGCRSATEPPASAESAADKYSTLPGLRQSHDPLLQAELGRLESEQATPALLDERLQQRLDSAGADPDTNLAEQLLTLYPMDFFPTLQRRCEELFSSSEFTFSPTRREAAWQVAQTYKMQRLKVREWLDRPGCHLRLPHREGVLADLSFTDVAQVACRLEAFEASQQIARRAPDEALVSLGYMLRLIRHFVHQPHLTLRIAGVHLRREAMLLTEAIANHPASSTKQRQLQRLVQAELTDWPSEAEVWFGERAQGLLIYEMIRDGDLLSLLTEDELAEYTKDESFNGLTHRVLRGIDEDERFYLQSMRELIEAVGQAPQRRVAEAEAIARELERRRSEGNYPWVAGDMLLDPVVPAQQWLIRDRALVEGWSLLLKAALDGPSETYPLSPLTGEPYRLRRSGDEWVLWGARDDPRNLTLRLRTQAAVTSKSTAGSVY